MPRNEKAERAKLFLPYDALKGFRALLKEKERVVVPKRELSEDVLALMDYTFSQVEKGCMIRVVYEDGDEHVQVEGLVSKLDKEFLKTICIVDQTIDIKKIVDIEILRFPKNFASQD